MTDINYLKRLFQDYYRKNSNQIPEISCIEHREFGFIPWDEKPYMIRHQPFNTMESLKGSLRKSDPRHIYASGALYDDPGHPDMKEKGYRGCDFLIDIDVDHFITTCKNDHDFWYCNNCDTKGNGMTPPKCPKCKKMSFKSISWICETCLNIAKKEIVKITEDFLIPDFNLDERQLKVAFSGHRGYHLKIENENLRVLSSAERREITDYLTGENISYEILGLEDLYSNLNFLENNFGWTKKIIKKIKRTIKDYPNHILIEVLKKYGFNSSIIEYILNDKENFLSNLWNIEGLGKKTWIKFLENITKEIGAKIDVPVSIDLHRLIRCPGSLHGSTGFRVQELSLSELEHFNPLNEYNDRLNPIVFEEKKNTKIKIEITENVVPSIEIKDEKYGPYIKGEIIVIPLHIAVFLLCKGVAMTRSFIEN